MARSRDPDYLGPDFGWLGPRLGPRSLYKGQRTRRLAIWSETGFISNPRDLKLPLGVEDCGPLGTVDEAPSLRLAWRGGWLKCQTLLILRLWKWTIPRYLPVPMPLCWSWQFFLKRKLNDWIVTMLNTGHIGYSGCWLVSYDWLDTVQCFIPL